MLWTPLYKHKSHGTQNVKTTQKTPKKMSYTDPTKKPEVKSGALEG
jgi:hypothetical protein